MSSSIAPIYLQPVAAGEKKKSKGHAKKKKNMNRLKCCFWNGSVWELVLCMLLLMPLAQTRQDELDTKRKMPQIKYKYDITYLTNV